MGVIFLSAGLGWNGGPRRPTGAHLRYGMLRCAIVGDQLGAQVGGPRGPTEAYRSPLEPTWSPRETTCATGPAGPPPPVLARKAIENPL